MREARNLLLRVLGWFAALPYLFVAVLTLTGPATWSGVLYVLAMGAMLIGLMTLPMDGKGTKRRPRGITRAGLGVVVGVAMIRCCTASDGNAMHMSDGHGGSARIVDRLVDEKDIAVSGTRVLTATHMLHDDADELPGAMGAMYTEMRKAEGDAPSPVVATYLGLQHPSAYDLVVIDPPSDVSARSDAGVIFLHGYAGNFDLPCWQTARAVAPLGIVTACPSARWVGDWWTPEGERIVRRTVDVLHARGVKTIVLAGLSNGGYGAARLAPRMRGSFAGLVLISGAPEDAASPGVPTLVIHGTKDTMAPVESARVYASTHGARFIGLDAGHFAMLVRADASDRALRDFVRTRIGDTLVGTNVAAPAAPPSSPSPVGRERGAARDGRLRRPDRRGPDAGAGRDDK